MKKPLPLFCALVLGGGAQAKIEHVLHITIDGLRADALKAAMDHPANASAYPGFRRLVAEGAATFQARCDFDYSETIPNHTGIVTGRPVNEPAGFTPAPFTADPDSDTLTAPGHGLRTGDNVLLATSGTLPGGLTATSVIYRATAVTADTFQLSTYATATGLFTTVDITSAGSGASTFVKRVSHGFSANFPGAGEHVHKLGTAPLAYKYSTFDMAHDRGLTTGIIAGKTRHNLFVDSYGATLGATDLQGTDNGRNKLDYVNVTNAGSAASLLVIRDAALARISGGTLNHYTLLHFTDTDTGQPGGGHTVSWNTTAWIEQGTKVVDGYLNALLTAITDSDTYRGRVAIIITADHGGGQAAGTANSHADASAIYNINIPLLLWGPGVPGGVDAYRLFRNRADPGPAGRPNSAPATIQPLRNTDTANIAMTLLGLPPVTGSYFRPEIEESLSISAGEGGIVLEWPLYLTGHRLITLWGGGAVSEPPVETASRFRVVTPLQGRSRFWALQPPQ
jgi:hypothetical protein